MALFASLNRGSFEACPEFSGRGVIVDFTPLKKQQGQFGEREVFKAVVEVDLRREGGTPYCVWSKNMTLKLDEKANLRKFIKSVLGRDLGLDELKQFDVEKLLGLPVHVVVVQNQKDGETYANIALIQPHKNGEPLQPSGKYVRVKDRPPKDANGYCRTEQQAANGSDLGGTRIHVGKFQGLELRDVSPEQVRALSTNWLPTAKANPKPTADDKRLIAALEWWQTTQATAVTNDDDNVPY